MAPWLFFFFGGGLSAQGHVNLILLTKLSTLLMLVDEELAFLLGDASHFLC